MTRQCHGVTRNGTRCKNPARNNKAKYCALHAPSKPSSSGIFDIFVDKKRARVPVAKGIKKPRRQFNPPKAEGEMKAKSKCAQTCYNTTKIPEQGQFGSCSIISVLVLVLETPCLNEYLKKVNPLAYVALDNIKKTIATVDTGEASLENKVCPYLPISVWKTYEDYVFGENLDVSFDIERQRILSGKTDMKEIYSNPEYKYIFLKSYLPAPF